MPFFNVLPCSPSLLASHAGALRGWPSTSPEWPVRTTAPSNARSTRRACRWRGCASSCLASQQRPAVPAGIHDQRIDREPAVVRPAVLDQLEAGACLADILGDRVLVVGGLLRLGHIAADDEDDLELDAEARPAIGANDGLVLEHALLADRAVAGALEAGLRQDLRRGQRDLVAGQRALLDDLLLQERVLDLVGLPLVVGRELRRPPADDGARLVDLMRPVGDLGDASEPSIPPPCVSLSASHSAAWWSTRAVLSARSGSDALVGVVLAGGEGRRMGEA